MTSLNKIEKQVTLRAPMSRAWKAITDAAQFSSWFGVNLHDDFAEGQAITATFTKEINEAAIIEHQKKLGLKPSKIKLPEKNMIFCIVERIEAERYFSFRWIPYGIDAEADLKNEPPTLVEFLLEKTSEGTLLTISESGFDQVPAHRRERAFRMNDGGWAAQVQNVKKYVEAK